jgi:hypothetical protein
MALRNFGFALYKTLSNWDVAVARNCPNYFQGLISSFVNVSSFYSIRDAGPKTGPKTVYRFRGSKQCIKPKH